MGKKLTEKEKIFCREFIFDWNATRAAKAAGYSAKTAAVIGHQNLRKLYIQKEIEEIQKELEKISGISRLRVLKEYEKLAFSSIAHIHDSWIEKKAFDKLTDDQKTCISEIQTRVVKKKVGDSEIVDVEEVKVKLHDKSKALDSITKMLGYNEAEKHDHTSGGEQITGMIVK
jgi:phage terminase small subunit